MRKKYKDLSEIIIRIKRNIFNNKQDYIIQKLHPKYYL